MSEAKQRPVWTWNSYLAWEAEQPIRYKLVDGEVHATGGGTTEPDIICNNLRAELRTRVKASQAARTAKLTRLCAA